MGCCETREKDEQVNVGQALNDEFGAVRKLVAKGSSEHIGETDLVHFSHSFQLNSEQDIQEVYAIEGATLGTGGSGVVRKGVHKATQAVRAVKIIGASSLERGGLKALQHEVGIMRILDHPHIVKLFEVFHDTRVYLVMELCTGGELFDRIVSEAEYGFTEFKAASYMKQILSAICYLHTHGVVHRDLKPENFMLQDPTPDSLIKVIDFGIAAKVKEGGELTARVGTTSYVAPEVLTGQRYAHKVDIWSCGVVCYILLSGCPPFSGLDKDIMSQIKHARYDFPNDPWGEISDSAKDFVRSMLQLHDWDRPSATQCLQHAWIQKQSERTSPRPLKPSMAKNFQNFNSSRKLKKLALTLIATQMQQDDIDELHQQFMALDTNGDGVLSKEELEKGFPDMPGIMENLDTDGSGEVDWSEFKAAALDRQQYQRREVLWSAFHVFDVDGDGTITKEELKRVLEVGSGAGISDELVSTLIAEADEDGDGQISFEEFKKMMSGSDATPVAKERSPTAGPVAENGTTAGS